MVDELVDESRCAAIEAFLLEAPPESLTIDALPPHVADCADCQALLEQVRADQASIEHAVEEFASAPGFDAAFAAALSEAELPAPVAVVPDVPRPAPRVDGPPATHEMQVRMMGALAASLGILAVLAVVGLAAWFASLPTSIDVFGPEDGPVARAIESGGEDGGNASGAIMGWEEVYDVDLEAVAIRGELPLVERLRLNALVESERTAHEVRARASRMLMVDAFSAGREADWARLIERHLARIESSDPDLIYKYVLHLSKVDGDPDVMERWVERALSRRSAWTGDTRTSRVYSLHKLRTFAALERWRARSGDRSAQDAVGRAALEWRQLAERVGRDASNATEVCEAAWSAPDCASDTRVSPEPAKPAPEWNGLDDAELEARARGGRLHPSERVALRSIVEQEDARMTDRDRASRLLMDDAFADGRRHDWETALRYHLTEIDQSDPDLCYELAFYASRKGPSQARDALHWAEVALVNRTVWTGALYTSRVHDLYALRARAAEQIWLEHDTRRRRQEAAAAAREWLEFAVVAERDTDAPRALCESMATEPGYCGGTVAEVTEEPANRPFEDIQSIQVRRITESGLVEVPLAPTEESFLKLCMIETVEIPEASTLNDWLRSTYLLEISDRHGVRSFELYTERNLKGNGGRYYANGCLYVILQQLDR